MKYRPILMSAPMVRAILDGLKTQTRMVVKPQPKKKLLGTVAPMDPRDFAWPNKGGLSWTITNKPNGPDKWAEENCPYGVPGDRLWVKETWQDIGREDRNEYIYLATVEDGHHPATWRPSIHMPRWASRLTLKVVSVRVERVRDISEADAVAESFKDKAAFLDTFFNINKRAPKDTSPWVWVVEFKRVEA